MIKTTIAGEALKRALEKQQRYVDAHVSDATQIGSVTTPVVSPADTKYFTTARRQKLRMAKATLRARHV